MEDNKCLVRLCIGMPVYNGEKYVSGAIETILAQTFKDFTLIISDNCSTDRTADICKKFAKSDSRIVYHRQDTNIGSLQNFKFLLHKSSAEYFMWASHDDRWEASYAMEMIDVLDQDPSIGLSFSGMKIKDLSTGTETKYLTGFTTQRRKWFKYLFRTIQGSVNLVYGVHRIEKIKKFPLDSYDYFDVLMGRWYELESKVVVVPKFLFTTGRDGKRIPYSLTGDKLDLTQFRYHEKALLKKHFKYLWPIFYLWSRIVGIMTRVKL